MIKDDTLRLEQKNDPMFQIPLSEVKYVAEYDSKLHTGLYIGIVTLGVGLLIGMIVALANW